jgi:hypothetical protein
MLALFGWLIAASAPLQAHRSLAGVYDMKKETELAAQRGVGKTGENALHNGDSIKVKFRPAKDGVR